MKFAHFADCHIGGWRDPKLKNIGTQAFSKAVDSCIEKKMDFVLIAGDLFNTSLPSIDSLKDITLKLKELKDNEIATYIVPGSHDFSASGKTILDVLENAGLFVNVAKAEVIDGKLKLKFTIDPKTNTKITGMLGKKGGLEKTYYQNLIKENLESEKGFKIFLFHSALTELKPKEMEKMDSSPLSFLPKGFDYYAGGHPHYIFNEKIPEYGIISYPGPLFPNNFRELEKLGCGGFYIYEDGVVTFERIQIYNTFHINIDCNNKTPEEIQNEIRQETKNQEFIRTIITIRLHGTLKQGKPSDINFKHIFEMLYGKSAYFVMKSTTKLTTKEFEEIRVGKGSVEDTEKRLILENVGQKNIFEKDVEIKLINELMNSLGQERLEDEKVADFEKRVKSDITTILNLQ